MPRVLLCLAGRSVEEVLEILRTGHAEGAAAAAQFDATKAEDHPNRSTTYMSRHRTAARRIPVPPALIAPRP